MKRGILLGVGALALIAACEFGVAPGGGTGVDGIVVNARGERVAGARVRVYPASAALGKASAVLVARAESTVTDAAGRYRFGNLPKGTYNLEAAIRLNDTDYFFEVLNIVYLGKKIDLGADTLRVGTGENRAGWRATGAAGYTFYAPAELEFLGEPEGLDTWQVGFRTSGIYLGGVGGMIGPLGDLSGKSGYGSENIIWNDSTRARLHWYHEDGSYRAVLQVFHGTSGTWVEGSTRWMVDAGTAADWRDALHILRSIRPATDWVGGPAPTTPPGKPSLVAPANNAVDSLTPLLSWGNSSGLSTTYFRVQIALDSAFTQLRFNDSVPATMAMIGTLQLRAAQMTPVATHHYWRVVAYGPGGSTSSEIRRIRLEAAPSPVELLAPANGQENASLSNTRLSWTPVAGTVTHYLVEVARDSLLQSLYASDTLNSSTTEWTVPYVAATLDDGGWSMREYYRHFWRVTAIGPAGSRTSSVRNFVTEFYMPRPRELKAPAQSAVVSVTPRLEWGTAMDADVHYGFRVQVSKDAQFTVLAVNDSVRNPSFVEPLNWAHTVGALEPGTAYFWRIVSLAANPQVTVTSAVRSFTTEASLAGPAQPTLLSPPDGARDSLSALFSWSVPSDSNITSYRLQAATDSAFLNGVIDTAMPKTTLSVQHNHLLKRMGTNRDYYWRIAAVGPGGTTVSAARKVFFYPAPDAAQLAAPVNGQDSVDVSDARLSWNAPTAGSPVTSYLVEVSRDTLFGAGRYSSDSVPGDQMTWTVPYTGSIEEHGRSMLGATIYYWRVITRGPGGSRVSVRRQFTTAPTASPPE